MKVILRSAAALMVVSGIAGAQAAPACDPGMSASVGKATLFLQQASVQMQAMEDASKNLKQAIGVLTTPGKDQSDAVGRAYYLGQSYVLLLQQPGVPLSGPRSTYGIATNPTANIHLLAAADSAFNMVEAAQPACRTQIASFREQKPWLDAMNGAINAVNANQFDSAEVFAKRALTIDRKAPYAYAVIASVAMHRKQDSLAAVSLQQAIDAASTDTLYRDAKANALFDLANLYMARYDASTGAAKTEAGRKAVAAWEAYLPSAPGDANAGNAISSAGRILAAAKDTAGLSKLYAPMVANPAGYGENTLLNAGVLATQAGHPADGAKLFSAVLTKNPNQRDALKNVAASYIGAGQPEKIFPAVDKLVAIDPNNPDNWNLYSYAYASMLKSTKDPKLTKVYTDSLTKYSIKGEKISPIVQIREFSYGSSDHTVNLGGTIQNNSATPKSYAMQFEFLDIAGTVVGTQTVNVGPVAPKATVPFKATVQSNTAVGYRYKPIV